MAASGGGGTALGDARDWCNAEENYRKTVLQDRRLASRTVFRASFHSDASIAVATSDGSIISYSCSSMSLPSSKSRKFPVFLDPSFVIHAHVGPAYDLSFYSPSLLFSCGDDGHIRGWRWHGVQCCFDPFSIQGNHVEPIVDMVNPQHEGLWGARSPIPENNAIAVNEQDGAIFSACGDSCAYCWDVETGQCRTVFKGHTDYLHSVAVCKSQNQIITSSEDGTARIWDCRSAKCSRTVRPQKNRASKKHLYVTCVAVDESENWLACGSYSGLSVWSLISNECIFSTDCSAPVQDLLFDSNQILAVGSEPVLSRYTINGAVLPQIKCAPPSVFSVSTHPSGVVAVGGHGGLVDIISEFGSHLCTFVAAC